MNYNDWKNSHQNGTIREYAAERHENDEQIDLSGADLREAGLIGANLRGANLRWADLRGADLREAGLIWANLRGANLRGANLRGANLRGADLSGADGPFTLGAFGRHEGIAVGGYIAIGCERHTYDEWLERYEEIGKRHNYTTDEIADYGAWIHLAVTRQRRIEGTTT